LSEIERGTALMREAETAMRDGVDRLAAGWVVREVTRIIDAWGRLDDGARAQVLDHARRAGEDARARVLDELNALFALTPAEQRATPLQIVRSLRFEVTDVLSAAGIPDVDRDEFDARAFPDDRYGVVPKALADLGDDELGPMLMAWGVGKTLVLRADARDDSGDL
jgi:hypothetical protein